ncbi:MAG: phage tail protein [Boseongicola sp.]|nr:phage tail protein [Boseongicola sp.]
MVLRKRDARPVSVATPDNLVAAEGGQIVQTRDPVVDVPGRVRLNFIEADGDYQTRAEESVFPEVDADRIANSEIALVLTQAEGFQTTERWLSEVRAARDKVSFQVPPSYAVDAGDVIQLETDEVSGQFRVDRIEDAGAKTIEAVRVVAGAYAHSPAPESMVAMPPVIAPLPVWPVMLDLPLDGDDAVSPWFAVAAEPWPGTVAVYGSDTGDDWGYEATVSRPAIMGESLTPLATSRVGVFDRGPALEVKFSGGALRSIGEGALLSGGNAAVIGDPTTGIWEVFQFRDASLVGEDIWALSMRLRGQRGTDGIIPNEWPVGSTVVLLDESLTRVPIPASKRGVERFYRVGPGAKAVDHPAFSDVKHAASGISLMPLRPVHVRASGEAGSDIIVSWVRQTRIDGDIWSAGGVPLGEQSESYQLCVRVGGVVRREVRVTTPMWVYGAAEQAQDVATGAFTIEVAQISDRYGPGLFGEVTFND